LQPSAGFDAPDRAVALSYRIARLFLDSPIWRACIRMRAGIGHLASLSRLRFAAFEIFAQSELEPVLAHLVIRVAARPLMFVAVISHVRRVRLV
jgi:hypothetical protein